MPQMKHKRLNRDGWGFQYYPYYQIRIDDELFHGLACLIRLTDGEANYWETPKAGRIQVTGTGMTWLELIPDNTNRVITIKYFPDGTHDEGRRHYPTPMNEKYQPSVFYVDKTDGIEYDQDGIAVLIGRLPHLEIGVRVLGLAHQAGMLRVRAWFSEFLRCLPGKQVP